jgi:DNA-binding MarR family transcriptional regulator
MDRSISETVAAPASDAPQTPERLHDDEIEMGALDGFIGLNLRAAYEASYEDFARMLTEDATLTGDPGIRPGDFTILTLIANNPGISQTQIGRFARRDKSAVTKALRHLEDEGLIRRTRLPDDRRTQLSELTPRGAAMQARMQEKALDHAARIVELIGPDQHEALIAVLRQIIDGMPSRRRD